jgi:hypothetical protein
MTEKFVSLNFHATDNRVEEAFVTNRIGLCSPLTSLQMSKLQIIESDELGEA